MLIGIFVKQLSEKLTSYLDEKNGRHEVTTEWVNNWLHDNEAPFETKIIDQNGIEVNGFKVVIEKKKRT